MISNNWRLSSKREDRFNVIFHGSMGPKKKTKPSSRKTFENYPLSSILLSCRVDIVSLPPPCFFFSLLFSFHENANLTRLSLYEIYMRYRAWCKCYVVSFDDCKCDCGFDLSCYSVNGQTIVIPFDRIFQNLLDEFKVVKSNYRNSIINFSIVWKELTCKYMRQTNFVKINRKNIFWDKNQSSYFI